MQRFLSLASILGLLVSAACTSGGERSLPASPSDVSSGNSANVTAPTAASPGDDAQLDTVRPTLTVNNATSSGSGSKVYEFQIADNSGFAVVAGRIGSFVVAISQSGIPEGTDGKTSFVVPVDLLPTTRYFWRARALQGAAVGPWSNTMRFRTKVDSFKSGSQVFDILSNGTTVADEARNISYVYTDDPQPGAKLNGTDSFLSYRISTLSEGEVSFIARRVKPGLGYGRILTMQDTNDNFDSNAYRVRVEKGLVGQGERMLLQMVSQGNAPNPAETGGIGWVDNRPYFFKLEWRGGTARLRIWYNDHESGDPMVDLSNGYTAPYNPGQHTVVIGCRSGDSLKDIRITNLWIGPAGGRPASLGSALLP